MAKTDKTFSAPRLRLPPEATAALKQAAELKRQLGLPDPKQLKRQLGLLSPEDQVVINRVKQLRRELLLEEEWLDCKLGGRWWDRATRAPATKTATRAPATKTATWVTPLLLGDEPQQDDPAPTATELAFTEPTPPPTAVPTSTPEPELASESVPEPEPEPEPESEPELAPTLTSAPAAKSTIVKGVHQKRIAKAVAEIYAEGRLPDDIIPAELAHDVFDWEVAQAKAENKPRPQIELPWHAAERFIKSYRQNN